MKKYIAGFLLFTGQVCASQAASQDALELNVEDLLNVEVTSVSKKAQALNDSAAAIFVITHDDIKRTGATSIPEALRMAPGLDVARIDSNKWAVSARGFNSRFANKLLVLIDGRNTYTRSFSGVYWENQDVMLEDVERIEVIRGPGATLWGANAVNGVINIITKHSSKTAGGLLTGGGGTEEQGFGALRYGAQLGEDTTGRTYVKGFKRDQNTNALGAGAGDDWDKVQGGFRIDSNLTLKDELKLQGDLYHSHLNQTITIPQIAAPYTDTFRDKAETYGGNILGRWQHTVSTSSDYSLQLYYDYYRRNEAWFSEGRNTLDLDFQHRFSLLDNNEIIWGFGYQYTHDDTRAGRLLSLSPTSRNDQLFSTFVQDEMELIDQKLWLTLGTKLEHNDYSGFEGQPTARLMWTPHSQHRIWGAVSRAVRTPSRAEHNMSLLQTVVPPSALNPFPTEVNLQGTRNFRTEDVIAYELGYRTTFIKSLSIDIAGFYNDYKNLRYPTQVPYYFDPTRFVVVQPVPLGNDYKAKTYGFEVATVWQMLDWWRWDANYSLLKTDMQDTAPPFGTSPQQRVSLRSALSVSKDLDFDLWFKYVDNNTSATVYGMNHIKNYVTMDARLAWRPVHEVELSLVGQNLFASSHLEYQQENMVMPTLIDRGMYGKASWSF
ncbi:MULTISPECIES: TonB-dependent receptor plug domain-containing protein [Methylomonas]|uniref:TonB-dependent receptor n=2 Tax=Methylomonas TaxID=416 RepID=A0A140E6M2_9GAMM|nr:MULTISPECIES: TonB-dependent receptor [Methylomonas]AMK79046.1 TonB-dependent receptor [Methylomonas denitrificans]OAI00209.1 TonB-dependent receptor [Methylomonas methanica]TCV79161.1 iron complex outermembrane receptor protein [Methylomonas methanica]